MVLLRLRARAMGLMHISSPGNVWPMYLLLLLFLMVLCWL